MGGNLGLATSFRGSWPRHRPSRSCFRRRSGPAWTLARGASRRDGVARSSLSKWYRGHGRPWLAGVLRLAALGGWSSRAILEGQLISDSSPDGTTSNRPGAVGPGRTGPIAAWRRARALGSEAPRQGVSARGGGSVSGILTSGLVASQHRPPRGQPGPGHRMH